MGPVLIDVPSPLLTPRLVLRAPVAGDGPKALEAILATLPELLAWMPWAVEEPRLEETEAFLRNAQADFIARRDLVFYGFAREADGSEGPMVVGAGLHRFDWRVRRFEIGYWRRRGYGGQGIVDEAVHALTRMAFERLAAQRVEIRMDALNHRSARVAERCGFTFEGCLRQDSRTRTGEPRDTRVYAKVRGVEWPGAAEPPPAALSPAGGAG